MSTKNVNSLIVIRKNYLSMSDVEKKIADFILNYPEKAINITTNSLAKKIGVSEGSIIKFANQIGFSGFTKLKIDIAKNIETHSNLTFDNIENQDNPKDVLNKMIENSISAFKSSYDIISSHTLEKASKAIMNAKKRIEIYGIGTSSMVANDAYYRLMRIGLPTYAVTDAHISSISASMLDEQCVAIGISHSGRTIETLRNMEIAKSKGAKTICVTSYANSPIDKLCDISIVIASMEALSNQEAIVSRLTQLIVLDSICSYISCQMEERAAKLIDNYKDILEEHRRH